MKPVGENPVGQRRRLRHAGGSTKAPKLKPAAAPGTSQYFKRRKICTIYYRKARMNAIPANHRNILAGQRRHIKRGWRAQYLPRERQLHVLRCVSHNCRGPAQSRTAQSRAAGLHHTDFRLYRHGHRPDFVVLKPLSVVFFWQSNARPHRPAGWRVAPTSAAGRVICRHRDGRPQTPHPDQPADEWFRFSRRIPFALSAQWLQPWAVLPFVTIE